MQKGMRRLTMHPFLLKVYRVYYTVGVDDRPLNMPKINESTASTNKICTKPDMVYANTLMAQPIIKITAMIYSIDLMVYII